MNMTRFLPHVGSFKRIVMSGFNIVGISPYEVPPLDVENPEHYGLLGRYVWVLPSP